MANMSYCRFQNTLGDLEDCAENIGDEATMSDSERRAMKRLIQLCRQIADDYTDEDGNVNL